MQRRRLILASAYSLLGIMIMGAAAPADAGQGMWNMPDCSWKRDMGDRPVWNSRSIDASPGITPQAMTKKGMPVGGFGTGSMMMNLCGSFGPFHMKPTAYEERFLSQAAFHVREECGGQSEAYTLATEDVLPAWNKLKAGDAEYRALFPKASFDYRIFKNSRVSMMHFSPVIAHNYKETSYPIGMFLFKARNTQDKPVKLSFMFTFPNADLVMPAPKGATAEKVKFRPRRKGPSNHLVNQDGCSAVVMTASHEENTPETQNTSWCIATEGEATALPSWEGEGDGSDVWSDFIDDGKLTGTAHSAAKLPGGAICVTVELKPGEEKVVPFALSWNFPEVQTLSGTRWWKRYTEYFPASKEGKPEENQAFAIAKTGLKEYKEWLKKVDNWTLPIAENERAPTWLRTGALNELYYNVFGGSFWENGCINAQKKCGDRPGAHVYAVVECVAYPFMESLDVRHHPARVTRDLWPKNERDLLLAFSDFIKNTTLGSAPHDLGSKNPINKQDDYALMSRSETTPWSEFSPKFILQSYMYWKQYKDDAFLDDIWNSAVRTFRYQVTTDKNNDGLSEMKSSEYLDNKLLNAILWVVSLDALEEMAIHQKDEQILSECRYQMKKARPNTEKQFWNERLGYYTFNEKTTFLMADAMIGQRCADTFGMRPSVDEKRLVSHLTQCFKRLVKPLKDSDGDGVGDLGAANVLDEHGIPAEKARDGPPIGAGHHLEVWTGVSYNLAASMYHWGKQTQNKKLMEAGILTGKGVYEQCWNVEENGFWFQSPESLRFNTMPSARGLMYQRARGIWELYQEVAGDT